MRSQSQDRRSAAQHLSRCLLTERGAAGLRVCLCSDRKWSSLVLLTDTETFPAPSQCRPGASASHRFIVAIVPEAFPQNESLASLGYVVRVLALCDFSFLNEQAVVAVASVLGAVETAGWSVTLVPG